MIERVVVYGEPSVPEIDPLALARRLAAAAGAGSVGATARPRGLFGSLTRGQARALAACIVHSPRRPFERREPDEAAVEREMRGGSAGGGAGNITYYDGFEMQRAASRMIPAQGAGGAGAFHIVLTDRFTCTYDPGDMRYHGRALIAANPSIISATGIAEAPARPRQYYIDLIGSMAAGMNKRLVDERYAGSYIGRRDARLGEVAYGYALQAASHHITGEAFCGDRGCRLYNAHWQSDLIHSQLRSGRLCRRHGDAFGAHAASAARRRRGHDLNDNAPAATA